MIKNGISTVKYATCKCSIFRRRKNPQKNTNRSCRFSNNKTQTFFLSNLTNSLCINKMYIYMHNSIVTVVHSISVNKSLDKHDIKNKIIFKYVK